MSKNIIYIFWIYANLYFLDLNIKCFYFLFKLKNILEPVFFMECL